jgi:hypothetical protein
MQSSTTPATLCDFGIVWGNLSYAKPTLGSGCSVYRTPDLVHQCQQILATTFPQYCSLRPAKHKASGIITPETMVTRWSRIRRDALVR